MNPLGLRTAGVLLLFLSACSSNSDAPTDHPDTGGEQDISDVIYVGGVTDEALEHLLNATPKHDPLRALIVDPPDLSAPLPQDKAATFTFKLAPEARRAPDPRLGPGRPPRSRWRHAAHEVLQFLSPERIAHAHGTPYNGTAYYLVITDAASKTKLQVFTPEMSYTPEAVDWQNLVQAAQPLTLTITSADFDDNSIPAGSGPFAGGTFPFTIE
jgi:hypothetical protein